MIVKSQKIRDFAQGRVEGDGAEVEEQRRAVSGCGMKIALDVRVWSNPFARGPIARWRDSEPFVENERGLLIHRPRYVNVYSCRGKAHISVKYYCGNCVSNSRGGLTFLGEPPPDALLCAFCEARAVMAGLPTATSLAGRHVHTGKLRAIMTCCGGQQ